jgi:hypothetical protein
VRHPALFIVICSQPTSIAPGESDHAFSDGVGSGKLGTVAQQKGQGHRHMVKCRTRFGRSGNRRREVDPKLGSSFRLVERLSSCSRTQPRFRNRLHDRGGDVLKASGPNGSPGSAQLSPAPVGGLSRRARTGWRSVADSISIAVLEATAIDLVGTVGIKRLAEHGDYGLADWYSSRAGTAPWILATGNVFKEG